MLDDKLPIGARLAPSARRSIVAEDVERILAADLPWNAFDGATVLVSGASGLLPAYMVDSLLTRGGGTTVVALVRSRRRAEERFERWLSSPHLIILEQDVCEPCRWAGPADYIIHAASQASPKYFATDPVGTALPNVLGAINLLQLAAKASCKGFLFFSSAEVYGAPVAPAQLLTEDSFGRLDPMTVRACYAESKRLGETLCAAFHKQAGLRTVAVRPFHTYGPGMQLDDGRVFADFVRDIVMGRNIVLTSAGTAERAFCYIGDATAGFFTALLKGAAATSYNVGNPDCIISVRGLAELLVSLFPKLGLEVEMRGAPDGGYLASAVERHAPDVGRIRELGWSPETGLEDGFRRTIRSYLTEGGPYNNGK